MIVATYCARALRGIKIWTILSHVVRLLEIRCFAEPEADGFWATLVFKGDYGSQAINCAYELKDFAMIATCSALNHVRLPRRPQVDGDPFFFQNSFIDSRELHVRAGLSVKHFVHCSTA